MMPDVPMEVLDAIRAFLKQGKAGTLALHCDGTGIAEMEVLKVRVWKRQAAPGRA